jgi:hypothetical protein
MYFTNVDIFSELIQIKCECPGMESKTKSFLLDNGRLQYEAVRRAFDLVTLEIVIGLQLCRAHRQFNLCAYIKWVYACWFFFNKMELFSYYQQSRVQYYKEITTK